MRQEGKTVIILEYYDILTVLADPPLSVWRCSTILAIDNKIAPIKGL